MSVGILIVEDERRRAAKYGAREFVTKPVGFELLKAQLQQQPDDSGQ